MQGSSSSHHASASFAVPSQNLEPAQSRAVDRQSTSPLIVLIAVVLSLGALFVASSLLVPIVIALVAYLTLRPIVARLNHRGIEPAAGSVLVVAAFFTATMVAVTLLFGPLRNWLAAAVGLGEDPREPQQQSQPVEQDQLIAEAV